jgi:hypothetical protein
MGVPAQGFESLFRNSMRETVRFLDTKHRDHYKVYNLCIEPDRQYSASLFHDRVAKFPFAVTLSHSPCASRIPFLPCRDAAHPSVCLQDHCAPRLAMVLAFCRDAHAYLTADKKNVIAVHCKAGKGRTGTMISACAPGPVTSVAWHSRVMA